jgi:hypothetical protein
VVKVGLSTDLLFILVTVIWTKLVMEAEYLGEGGLWGLIGQVRMIKMFRLMTTSTYRKT